jgi:hypothetical protein
MVYVGMVYRCPVRSTIPCTSPGRRTHVACFEAIVCVCSSVDEFFEQLYG